MEKFVSVEVVKAKKVYSRDRHENVIPVAEIDWIPPADVVARDAFNRILAENDTMRKQLAQIGKKPGDSMDDVRPIIKGRWLWDRGTRTCIVCGQMKATDKKDSFCSCCGADNREVTTE